MRFNVGDEVLVMPNNKHYALANATLHTVIKVYKNSNFRLTGHEAQFRQSGTATGYASEQFTPKAIMATEEARAERQALRDGLLAKISMGRMADALRMLAARPVRSTEDYRRAVEHDKMFREVLMPMFEGMAYADSEIREIFTRPQKGN